jgi:hypothetical protein
LKASTFSLSVVAAEAAKTLALVDLVVAATTPNALQLHLRLL